MSSLYPARRIPQGMILIGSTFVAGAVTMAVGHFGFGVPVYDRNTGQASSDLVVATLVLAFGGLGILVALTGRAVLRVASRHSRKWTIRTKDS